MQDGLLITNVTVIDAKNGQREAMNVRILENRIVALTAANNLKNPKATTILDGTGKYLIPGLWDAHVHLTYDMDLTPSMFGLFLKHGITSVRDTGGEIDLLLPLKQASEKDQKNTPRVKITGPLLDGIPTVYYGDGKFPKLGVSVPTIAEAKKQVLALHEAGVDMLKVYEMLSPEIFSAILRMADSLQLPVTGHVPLSLDALDAANAGMQSMEHLRNLEFAFTKNWDSLLLVRRNMLTTGIDEAGMKLRADIHKAQRNYALAHNDAHRQESVLKTLR